MRVFFINRITFLIHVYEKEKLITILNMSLNIKLASYNLIKA